LGGHQRAAATPRYHGTLIPDLHCMKPPLKILHLEDEDTDAALIRGVLEADGVPCAIERVSTREAFIDALQARQFDLILSDYALPAFDGMTALEMARKEVPEVPFILVSGTLGEDLAVESLKNGATDYVIKGRFPRLAPAVRRAMRDAHDRAERKRLEEQFVQSQKMEVLGQLAGGVAHDFNNILGVIMGYSDLMVCTLSPSDPMHDHAREIRDAAELAAGLTRQLLIFSRKQKVESVVLDLAKVVADMEKMVRQLIGENIELNIVPTKASGRVKADAGYAGQVLMNMAVNARDAMPHGGRLSIEIHDVTLTEEDARAHCDAVVGDHVMISISDTGTGMTPEVKAKLFEPFFTTKERGKGTGLGLATCHTIVRQAGGHIDVESEFGKGTTFKVYFPRIDHALEIGVAATDESTLPRGNETVLFVEDQTAVRDLACSVLESHGYRVLRAANGQEGLHVADEHEGTPISLVVTDVVMPQMGGKVMVEWLKATYPDLKVLFTSGYTDDAIAHHGVLDPGVAFLSKPYGLAGLMRKVREVLDEKPVSMDDAEVLSGSFSMR